MKLIVQIPCLNEEATLPATIADVPRQIEGISRERWSWLSMAGGGSAPILSSEPSSFVTGRRSARGFTPSWVGCMLSGRR